MLHLIKVPNFDLDIFLWNGMKISENFVANRPAVFDGGRASRRTGRPWSWMRCSSVDERGSARRAGVREGGVNGSGGGGGDRSGGGDFGGWPPPPSPSFFSLLSPRGVRSSEAAGERPGQREKVKEKGYLCHMPGVAGSEAAHYRASIAVTNDVPFTVAVAATAPNTTATLTITRDQ